jgi:lysophospholipase L1-like esterase
MPRFAPRLALFLAGMAFAFLLLEGTLRLFGGMWSSASRTGPAASGAVLVLGNSHTKGMRPEPGYSYPDQLALQMKALSPAKALPVVNAGELNVNSSEILRILRAKLREVRPSIVVLMAGEANTWNRRLAAEALAPSGPTEWLLRHSEAARFLYFALSPDFRGAMSKRREGYSSFFLDTPLAEYPTLAMRWTGHLAVRGDFRHRWRPALEEAEAAIRRWQEDPRSGPLYTATRVLASLELYLGHPDEALAALERLAGQPGTRYDERLYAFALEKKPALAAGGREARWRALLRKLGAGRVPERAYRATQDAVLHARQPSEGELRAAVLASPGDLVLAAELASRLVKSGRREEAERLFLESLRDNPFHSAGELPPSHFFLFFDRHTYRSLLERALPPAAVPALRARPAEALLAGSLLRQGDVFDWAYRDLVRMVREARAAGARVVLETYPPERFSGKERAIDQVIRRVAADERVPLSDTSAELRRIWGGGWTPKKADGYYGTPGLPVPDDHLNGEGNRLVGKILLEDLERFGLWRP